MESEKTSCLYYECLNCENTNKHKQMWSRERVRLLTVDLRCRNKSKEREQCNVEVFTESVVSDR